MLNININGYKQISKPAARKLYESGQTVYLYAAHMSPGMWGTGYDARSDLDGDFTALCNSFIWYNCSPKTGKYIRFYIYE